MRQRVPRVLEDTFADRIAGGIEELDRGHYRVGKRDILEAASVDVHGVAQFAGCPAARLQPR
jgi:hypothetical protein